MCDKVVCERWCVTKLCVKDGVCDKVAFERSCATKLREAEAEAAGRRRDGIQNQKQEPHSALNSTVHV